MEGKGQAAVSDRPGQRYRERLDGKKLIENSFCGKQLRHLTAAIPAVFGEADTPKAL